MFQSVKTFYSTCRAIYLAVYRLPKTMANLDTVRYKPLYEHGKDKPSNGYRFDAKVGKTAAQGIVRNRKSGNARILKKIATQGRNGYCVTRNKNGQYLSLVEGTQFFNGFMGVTRGDTTNGYHLGKRSVYIERKNPHRMFWDIAG